MVQEFNSNFLNLTAVEVKTALSVDGKQLALHEELPGQYARYWINSTDGQSNLANFVEYITRWNRSFIGNPDYIDRGEFPSLNP